MTKHTIRQDRPSLPEFPTVESSINGQVLQQSSKQNTMRTLGMLSQKDCKFKVSLGYIARTCLLKEKVLWSRTTKKGDPRWQLEHSHRPSDLHDPGTLIRSWRHA
jgi:hypothetical protein